MGEKFVHQFRLKAVFVRNQDKHFLPLSGKPPCFRVCRSAARKDEHTSIASGHGIDIVPELPFCQRVGYSILFCQNSVLVLGIANNLHPSCPCQKHPLTNIAVLYLRITMSGLPGTFFTFNLYLYPCAQSHSRTSISGFVALLRICDMQRWRCGRCQDIGHVSLSIKSLFLRT